MATNVKPLFGGSIEYENNRAYEVFVWSDRCIRCKAIYNPVFGHFCGYVEVPNDNRFHKFCSYELERLLNVHGGITFHDIGGFPLGPRGDITVVGFDCAHLNDRLHKTSSLYKDLRCSDGATFKDLAYVKHECGRLVDQLKGVRTIKEWIVLYAQAQGCKSFSSREVIDFYGLNPANTTKLLKEMSDEGVLSRKKYTAGFEYHLENIDVDLEEIL